MQLKVLYSAEQKCIHSNSKNKKANHTIQNIQNFNITLGAEREHEKEDKTDKIENQLKARVKKWVLSSDLKRSTEGACLRSAGSLFQAVGP